MHAKMKKHQMIISAVWIGLSLFIMIFSYIKLGLGVLHSPGPGFFPFLIGGLLFVLSLYLLIAKFFGKGAQEVLLEEQKKVSYRKCSIMVASLILYGFFLEILGFVVATFLLLFFMFLGMGVRLRSAVVTAVLTILVTYFLFTYFGIRFPPGILRLVGIY